jgi:hypothetical protein
LSTEIRDAIKLLLSGCKRHIDVFPISLQGIEYFLIGYYRFAGRILSTERDVFGKRAGKIGKKALGSFENFRGLEK